MPAASTQASSGSNPVALARTLIDIDSTTGREAEAGAVLARVLEQLGYHVSEQPISDGRFNVYAHLATPPEIVFSTHFDCVPPFFPSREERGLRIAAQSVSHRQRGATRPPRPQPEQAGGVPEFTWDGSQYHFNWSTRTDRRALSHLRETCGRH